MKKNLLRLLTSALLATTLFSVQAYASVNISSNTAASLQSSSYSSSETLTVSSTPIDYEYSRISGYVKDSNGNPIANRTVALATNFNGVPSMHSYINATETCGSATTDSNGYYQFNLITRSSYSERYNPGRDCSYYAYLDTGKYYSVDELANYIQSGNSYQWPFQWILDSRTYVTSNVRTYIYS